MHWEETEEEIDHWSLLEKPLLPIISPYSFSFFLRVFLPAIVSPEVVSPPAVDVNVISHHMQRYAVWFGGSMLTSTVRKCGAFIGIVRRAYLCIIRCRVAK